MYSFSDLRALLSEAVKKVPPVRYYSAALKGQDITWNEASVNEWLQGPGKFVKGTQDDPTPCLTRKTGRTLSPI